MYNPVFVSIFAPQDTIPSTPFFLVEPDSTLGV